MNAWVGKTHRSGAVACALADLTTLLGRRLETFPVPRMAAATNTSAA